jgi:5-formyltetrahydrofolate cyclo-ligase
MDKEQMRIAARARRAGLCAAARRTASALAQDALLALPEVSGAGSVFCYVHARDEVETARVLAECAARGAVVCVPAFDPGAARYRPARWATDVAMRTGRFGMAEPGSAEWIPLDGIEVAVVPGLAFDSRGGRLGHGGGHYDRLLSVFDGFRVGLAFETQIVAHVPCAAYDVAMDAVVTETGVRRH